MRALRVKPWNPRKRQLVRTWVAEDRFFVAGVDVGLPGEKPSPIYTFDNDNDPMIDRLLSVKHHNVPETFVFEEVSVSKKDKELKQTLQNDIEDRVKAGGKQIRASVHKVEESDDKSQNKPKRRKRPGGKTSTGSSQGRKRSVKKDE